MNETDTAPAHASARLSDAEIDALVTSHLRLAYKIANEWSAAIRASDDRLEMTKAPSYADVAQEAALAMILSARSFDPSHGSPFAVHAKVAIRRHLRQWQRREERDGLTEVPKRMQRGPGTPTAFWPVTREASMADGDLAPEIPDDCRYLDPSPLHPRRDPPSVESIMGAGDVDRGRLRVVRSVRRAIGRLPPLDALAVRLRHRFDEGETGSGKAGRRLRPIRDVADRMGISVGAAHAAVARGEAAIRSLLGSP